MLLFRYEGASGSQDFTWTVPANNQGGDVYSFSYVSVQWNGGGVEDPSMGGDPEDGPHTSPATAVANLRSVNPGVYISKAEYAKAETTFSDNDNELHADINAYARVLHFQGADTTAVANGRAVVSRNAKKKTNGVVEISLTVRSNLPFDEPSGIATHGAEMEARAGNSFWIVRYDSLQRKWTHHWRFEQFPGGALENSTYTSDADAQWLLPTGTAEENWLTTQTNLCTARVPAQIRWDYHAGVFSANVETELELEAGVKLEEK
jgi:hypothetical protein